MSRVLVFALVLLPFAAVAQTQPRSPLDDSFQRLYNLDFAEAQGDFAIFEQGYSDDPLDRCPRRLRTFSPNWTAWAQFADRGKSRKKIRAALG